MDQMKLLGIINNLHLLIYKLELEKQETINKVRETQIKIQDMINVHNVQNMIHLQNTWVDATDIEIDNELTRTITNIIKVIEKQYVGNIPFNKPIKMYGTSILPVPNGNTNLIIPEFSIEIPTSYTIDHIFINFVTHSISFKAADTTYFFEGVFAGELYKRLR